MERLLLRRIESKDSLDENKLDEKRGQDEVQNTSHGEIRDFQAAHV